MYEHVCTCDAEPWRKGQAVVSSLTGWELAWVLCKHSQPQSLEASSPSLKNKFFILNTLLSVFIVPSEDLFWDLTCEPVPVSVSVLAARVSFQWALSCRALECVHSSLYLITFDLMAYCCLRVNLKFCFKHSVIFISLRSHYHETVDSEEEAVGSRSRGRYLFFFFFSRSRNWGFR